MARRLLIQTVAALAAAMLIASAAYASCIRLSPTQQRARADVIFDGIALENPTPTGIQASESVAT